MESAPGYAVKRAFYSATIAEFLQHSPEHIIGSLTAHSVTVEQTQTSAWLTQIQVLKRALTELEDGTSIYFEYVIPRLGKRMIACCS